MNDLILKALSCENTSRPPIWLMRQAGRYMPEYREYRAKYSFMEMYRKPELASEITLLPLTAFQFDAAILFSDILVIPEAMGVGLHFAEKKGPIIENPIRTEKEIDALCGIELGEKLKYVSDTIKMLVPSLSVPLLGFSGAPFTLASYMIEGGSSKDLKQTKQLMLENPDAFHKLLGKLTSLCIEYLHMQIVSGVHAVQIFDSWAHVLAYPQFREFSLHYLKQIVQSIKASGTPVILFCRGSSYFAPFLAEAEPSCISVDWNADLPSLRKQIPTNIALQGNLDPHVLFAPRKIVTQEANRILDGMHRDKGFIFNLGHGILPDTPVDSVKELVDCIQSR